MKRTATALLAAAVVLLTPAFAAVNIDYATIGNPNNPADPTTGYGSVSSVYRISRNETTIAQYAEFLNAAAQTDPFGLWNSQMTTNANIAGITRAGSSGSYTYSVIGGSGLRPITHVSWYDAARFANWLHNGQGSGSTETGAYTLTGNTGTIIKNTGASVWIPSENQWYKAAYYDPTPGSGGGDNYWRYPTQSDTLINNTVSANYFDGDYVGSGSSSFVSGNALTNVGAYGTGVDSFYGTNDQGGNVLEWNDAVFSNSDRGLRGGSWDGGEGFQRASYRTFHGPFGEGNNMGFRVASVPEPTSLVLTILSSGLLLARRRK